MSNIMAPVSGYPSYAIAASYSVSGSKARCIPDLNQKYPKTKSLDNGLLEEVCP